MYSMAYTTIGETVCPENVYLQFAMVIHMYKNSIKETYGSSDYSHGAGISSPSH